MKKYTVFITVITALTLAFLMLCGCVSPVGPANGGNNKATEAPAETEGAVETEAPDETEASEATEAPEATEEPAGDDLPEGSLTFEAVPFNEDHSCDMNGDGVDDVIRITKSAPNEYDYDYTVAITGGEGSAKAFECSDEISGSYEGYAILVRDSSGEHLPALALCTWHDSDDPLTDVYRISAEDGSLKKYEGWASFPNPDMGSPVVHGLLALSWRTDIMGTFDVTGYFTLGEDSFIRVSKDFEYPVNINYITVLRELPVSIVDDATGELFETAVAPTTWVMPEATDMLTYAYVLLSSGEHAYVFYDANEYPYTINGIPQEEYLDVMYCD